MSSNVLFASSNKNKFDEASKILSNFKINLEFFKSDLIEIQDDSISDIASQKVKDAFNKSQKPIIVEDDGLFIDSLNGFPGPYSSFIFKTIGNNGILELVSSDRTAKFVSVIAYSDGKNIEIFESSIKGKISDKPRGDGWGYDPIFIPENQNQTYAELTNKNQISHRYESLSKFASWFLNRQE